MENKAYLNDKQKLIKFKELQQSEQFYYRQLAEKVKTLKPYKRPSTNNKQRDSIIDKFKQKSYLERVRLEEENEFILKSNFICAERHSSLISNEELTLKLKETNLKEMFVNKIHKGTFIELKVIAPPYYSSGIHLLVQDKQGDLEQLIIYNYETKSYYTDPNELIPVNTRIQIKEPYLQLLSLEENANTELAIRVDSPSDLIVIEYNLGDCLSSTKSCDDLIDMANKQFSKTMFHSAIRLYTQAILKSNQTSSRAYLNRSQAYIKLEKYYLAYLDAKQACLLDAQNEKAHFRCGKAAYLQRKFQLALESFQLCFKLNSLNKEAEAEIRKCIERLIEEKNGVFNFKLMYDKFFKKEFFMDVADFKSNKFIIAEIENKSKGKLAILVQSLYIHRIQLIKCMRI